MLPGTSFADVRVIHRPNGGPASARNTGLENISIGSRYVAFLDSDDEWSTSHLAQAHEALSGSHDFFFANHLQLDQKIPAFERSGRLDYARHIPIGTEGDLYSYRGDMFDQIMRGNVIGTSTVVYDRQRFPDIRFREAFVSAGEDYLCWMDFATLGARFAFSTCVHATYGGGVNVYSGAQWGTVRHLDRVRNELRYRLATSRLFPISEDQRQFLAARATELRDEFMMDLLQIVKRRTEPFPFMSCKKQFLEDPTTFLALARVLARRLRKGIKG